MDAYVARQPIFRSDRSVYGYELLFRSTAHNAFDNTDGDFATASLIGDSLHVHGLQQLTDGRRCFINVTRQALLDEVYAVLPPDRTVVEILETVEPDEVVLEACRRVRKAGYLLALDDYVLEEKFAPLLPLIDILKVEFTTTTPEQQMSLRQLRERYRIQLLAEKLEEPDEFHLARRNRYTLFQGYFFCKPEMLQTRRLPASRMTYIRFLHAINQPEVNFAEVEMLIRQEVSLAYKLLRYLNSAAFGLRTQVTSIRRALVMLGERPLRKWASLVTINELSNEKPPELMKTCMVRARFCELLNGASLIDEDAGDMFMLGMFSLLDAMLDRPMGEVVTELALPTNIRTALTDHQSHLHQFIDLAIALERGDWPTINQLSEGLMLNADDVHRAYRDALSWSSRKMRELAEPEDEDEAERTLRRAS